MKLLRGPPERLRDLYQTGPTVWAASHSGLKEIRDLREVQVLSKLIAEINKNRIPEAVDIIAQRIREILTAKKSGSSWDKGALLSLMPSDQASMTTPLPDGALDL